MVTLFLPSCKHCLPVFFFKEVTQQFGEDVALALRVLVHATGSNPASL